ncbi:MAG: signal peptidase II [Chlamydiae bacterium]|nr:signal peptidase II [Chlamydiota bacterium]
MSIKNLAILMSLCLVVLGADILSKAYTCYYIPLLQRSVDMYPYGGVAVFHDFLGIDFSLNYVMNKGAAWGVFSSFQNYLLYARLLIILALVSYLVVVRMPVFKRFALAFIAAGAIGNVLDYFVYGHVVDMFYFRFWGYSYPVFNVADSSIFIGVALLFMYSFKEKKQLTSSKPH